MTPFILALSKVEKSKQEFFKIAPWILVSLKSLEHNE